MSYERRAYESVDIRSLFWVIPYRFAKSSTLGLKGLKKIVRAMTFGSWYEHTPLYFKIYHY